MFSVHAPKTLVKFNRDKTGSHAEHHRVGIINNERYADGGLLTASSQINSDVVSDEAIIIL